MPAYLTTNPGTPVSGEAFTFGNLYQIDNFSFILH
ncbi:Glutathione S-transferase [Caenorhabditis elegans]|uniref:Glutathione S-transferase n=1 Tax=Caenorhabditis elegans TaxID=6239 RepID=N1NSI3_CAEEL|nr:Glutathione S-transferase [Caenorhabditis elegans]CCW46011.1 Glutathione S-transferase [Caenorhabditis elegans]|eukprot:NP_001294086.1 Uncharacterized protein CELE_ZC518.8 [Caenorhabditis elegans]